MAETERYHEAAGGCGYCDDSCDRPAEHEGLCWANGMVWREATPEEEIQFQDEMEHARVRN